MYLTAHRVKTINPLKDNQTRIGINAFYYQHGDAKIPDVNTVTKCFPGELVSESYEVPPGGNHVLSYLDVVAKDQTDIDDIIYALDLVKRDCLEDTFPVIATMTDDISIRFGLDFGMEKDARFEFDDLSDKLISLYKTPPVLAATTPLKAYVMVYETDFEFELDKNSVKRVEKKHEQKWRYAAITISHDTKKEFEKLYGDIIPHIIEGLVGLPLEQIIELGGIEIFDKDTGELFRQWPSNLSKLLFKIII